MSRIFRFDMDIPKHVKRRAIRAVGERETTAAIRSYPASGQSVSHESLFTPAQELKPQAVPPCDEVKKQAMSAVSNPNTRAMIRLIQNGDTITPSWTPSWNSAQLAEAVVRMHKSGQSLDAIHRTITKDNFGESLCLTH